MYWSSRISKAETRGPENFSARLRKVRVWRPDILRYRRAAGGRDTGPEGDTTVTTDGPLEGT